MASRGLVLALSCALALGVGLALGLSSQWIAGSKAALAESVPAVAQSEEMTLLLKDVHRAIDLLTAEIQRRGGEPMAPAVESSQRRLPDASAPAPDSTELAAALKSLADAVRDLRVGAGTASGTRAEQLVKPVFVDREAAFAATGMERAAASGKKALELALVALNHSHMFLTNQAVLSRYGTPDSIHFEDSDEVWMYELPREEGNEEFTIKFHQGIVFECDFDPGH